MPWSRSFIFDGHRFELRRGVFDPVRHLSGIAFAQQLDDIVTELAPDALNAVDLGTGSGLLAATMARLGLWVVATDNNAAAISCAEQNCRGLDVDVRHGDMFEPLGDTHADLLIVNPPYERSAPTWRRSSAFTSADFLERLGTRAHDIAPVVVVGFPADNAAELAATELDLRLWRTVPTEGRDLGIFVSTTE